MTIPNYITFFRILLVPVFFTLLVSYEEGKEYYRLLALSVFIVASFSDALDGAIARATKTCSELGRFLDPLADKLLLLSGYIGLLLVQSLDYHPPHWVTVVIVFRDIFLVGGAVTLFVVGGKLRVEPNWLGKITTASQMLTLVVILLQWPLSIVLWYITAGLTIFSCLVYFLRDLPLLNGGSGPS